MTCKTLFLSAALCLSAIALHAAVPVKTAPGVDTSVADAFKNSMPGVTGFGTVVVNKISIDDKAKVINVDCNKIASYIPLDSSSLKQLKDEVRNALGSQYAKYKVNIYSVDYNRNGEEASRKSFDELALFADRKFVTPSEKKHFVLDMGAQPAPKGLDGKNIAVWQSHGWYFEPKLNRWEWQRARIFQTVEDLYTQSYVMPFLMPMLRNAGAYVMSPRERDTNRTELIVDNDGQLSVGTFSTSGNWNAADTVKTKGFAYTSAQLVNNQNPFREGSVLVANTTGKQENAPVASWTADFPEDGTYAVYISYASLPNSATDARYRVNSKAGARDFKINQQMGGGTWIYLGHFDFGKGTPELPVVELTGVSADKNVVVTADAVKIGGGMGNVARKVKVPLDSIDYQYVLSNYPRFVEGARYFLQWAGAPDSVYTPSDNVNDYTDDYRSRGEWVNWLAGGSSVLPQREGLNIPVDLSFAFHSDAGTTMNDSIIGTLGIYSTDGHANGNKYANGMDRETSRDLTNLVMTNIVNDIRSTFEPNWTRRGMWDASYYEARVPEVPAMLLELLSHQNFADMKYGLDPEFRFLVSRAIYKGMLQFLAQRDGKPYVVTPLAPRNFAISAGDGSNYRLTWSEQKDSLESTATPTYYIIEHRVNDGAFQQVAKVTVPEWTVNITDDAIHSYRIIAGNDGGVSFPSEVLALCHKPGAPVVNIVNGFTRISAPDWFDSGEIAGFYDVRDAGVPYIEDISYIGPMFEFRREIPWMDDDAAGFGASRANYEDKVIAGNTFDFVYNHGAAIAKAGYGFVSTSVEAFTNSTFTDNEPKIVDLILGKQKEIKKGRGVFGTRYKTFPSALQDKLSQYTKDGGSLFVSGAFVATDLWDNPNSSKEVAEKDQKFAKEVLGYQWRVGQASVTGEAYQVPTRFKAFTGGEYTFSAQPNADCYAVESPDSFFAADAKKACTLMRYTENNLVAGIAYNPGNYRTVVIGFPFETITNSGEQVSMMKQVLKFLSNAK